jgi:tetratricopeptide (TPR) repeat protein
MSAIKPPALRQVLGLGLMRSAIIAATGLALMPLAAQAQTARTATTQTATTQTATTQTATTQTATERDRPTPAEQLRASGMTFQRAMNIGYAASRQGDFNTALINFRRALVLRPGHPYASAAADNMAYYIQHERVTERQQIIDQLESQLTTAINQKDWVCSATTLDQLTAYTEPNSLNRERLIGQRGEVSGLLDARLNEDRWSTVCAAQQPVY